MTLFLDILFGVLITIYGATKTLACTSDDTSRNAFRDVIEGQI
ncbi:MAG: hypothetical protein OSB67_01385 [Alphaproteobacteria bacterium]|nr:hypothetical protein [Alphaproteobacteria bacterium]